MRKLLLGCVILLILSACNKEPTDIGTVPEDYDLTAAIDSLPQEKETSNPEKQNNEENVDYEEIPYVQPSESYELVKAACYGNNQLVKEILEKDTDNINKKSFIIELETTHTPLSCALTGTYEEGYTPKHKDVVKTLVAYGVDVNQPSPAGQDPGYCTPLQLAVENNDAEIAKLLIDNGADVNLNVRGVELLDSGRKFFTGFCIPALEMAEKKENHEMIKLLSEAGAVRDTKALVIDVSKTKDGYNAIVDVLNSYKSKE